MRSEGLGAVDESWAKVLVAVATLGGPFLAYLLAVRKTSGRIKSSDASELWEEAASIRRECAERVRALEARVRELEDINMRLQAENYRLMRISFGGEPQ